MATKILLVIGEKKAKISLANSAEVCLLSRLVDSGVMFYVFAILLRLYLCRRRHRCCDKSPRAAPEPNFLQDMAFV